MYKILKTTIPVLLAATVFLSCGKNLPTPVQETAGKEFKTSFESVADFSGFYITPQGHKGTAYHELADSIVYSGSFAHRAWITGPNPPSTATVNNNHRGYPTIQFYKTATGAFKTPCYITFRVWLDMNLQESTTGGDNDWFSFATFTDDESDNWRRTVLVNLDHNGFVHLQHTTNQGQQSYIYQTTSLTFPQREWVELKIYLDFSNGGYAKVWQNGRLVSHANIENIGDKLAQAHFGLYCPPQMKTGTVFNDDLVITEVAGE